MDQKRENVFEKKERHKRKRLLTERIKTINQIKQKRKDKKNNQEKQN